MGDDDVGPAVLGGRPPNPPRGHRYPSVVLQTRQTGGHTVPSMIPSSATAREPDRNGTGRFAVRREAGGPSAASTSGGSLPRLWGRRSECGVLDRLLDELRAGTSSVLVLRGEAGVGKTALLDYLLDHTSGCRVALAAGVESEMELAYAGLHQLCAPMLDRLERLPAPQRDALGTAFGLQAGGAPDRFLVGLAVLSLLSDVAEERPWSASSTMRSGSTRPRRRCLRSWRADSSRSPSRWSSPCASRATSTS